ncbi:hypothetical protein SPHINGO8AM_310005 [Sphingomonas sp. 8AM]|nr:hypothetical protein SPHINGO8AM_310005 [Sphingomonas sp. 8AM]
MSSTSAASRHDGVFCEKRGASYSEEAKQCAGFATSVLMLPGDYGFGMLGVIRCGGFESPSRGMPGRADAEQPGATAICRWQGVTASIARRFRAD